MIESDAGFLRIGELSRRTGVTPELLRAWERRYGVLRPTRSQGGFRLYSADDERRVRRMQALIGQGVAASQAAALVDEPEPSADAITNGGDAPMAGQHGRSAPLAQGLSEAIGAALESFDQAAADAALDRLFAALPEEQVIRGSILPFLRDVGERWERGEISVEQEHFASNVIRSRLLSLGRGWGTDGGKLAVLACLPGELHELGLICFALALRNRGWRVSYLGADTPVASLAAAVQAVRPDAVVVVGHRAQDFDTCAAHLRDIAALAPLAIAGPGADQRFADSVTATMLDLDPISAAAVL